MSFVEARVLGYLMQCAARGELPPTQVQIMRHFGWRSTGCVTRILRELHRVGAIEHTPRMPRGIKLVQQE